MRGLHQDTLFLACTRPTMFPGLGVPLVLGLGVIVATTELVVLTHWIFTVPPIGVAVLLACRIACADDHNRFRLIYLWCVTRGRASINAEYWAGSSASPLPQRRPRSAKEIRVSV